MGKTARGAAAKHETDARSLRAGERCFSDLGKLVGRGSLSIDRVVCEGGRNDVAGRRENIVAIARKAHEKLEHDYPYFVPGTVTRDELAPRRLESIVIKSY
jgi:hypothetical protein